jgi:CDP-diacylglycerol--glycerol-3-phosphate 3-phosphatidyltransferase
MLIFATVVGSLMVSYVRARAEGLGLDLKIGLLTRVERYLLVLLMLFTGKLTIGLAVIAALSNFTVIQRVARVYRLTREDLV